MQFTSKGEILNEGGWWCFDSIKDTALGLIFVGIQLHGNSAGIGIYLHMCKLYAKFNEADRIMLLLEFLGFICNSFSKVRWSSFLFQSCV